MENKKRKIAVGLSGGVDSSETAALLKNEGHDVSGLLMSIYDENIIIDTAGKNACYGPNKANDIASARSVCKTLDIPFHVIDLKKEFSKCVIEYFRNDYLEGRTPNPCIVCNRELKFGLLLKKASEKGIEFEKFATGHYARIVKTGGRFLLKRPKDSTKDQTYFLYSLSQSQLADIVFPLGEYDKNTVREMAKSIGLHTSERPESQDFIAGGDYYSLFTEEETKEGDIVDETGLVLGKHKGIVYYTIGQRRGLGIAAPQPLYVTKIDAGTNRIVVSDRDKAFSEGLIATDLNLIAVERLDRPYKVKAKIRLNQEETTATIFPHEKDKAKVLFEAHQMSVTPGQSVVLYEGDIVFGGGIIEQAL